MRNTFTDIKICLPRDGRENVKSSGFLLLAAAASDKQEGTDRRVSATPDMNSAVANVRVDWRTCVGTISSVMATGQMPLVHKTEMALTCGRSNLEHVQLHGCVGVHEDTATRETDAVVEMPSAHMEGIV